MYKFFSIILPIDKAPHSGSRTNTRSHLTRTEESARYKLHFQMCNDNFLLNSLFGSELERTSPE